MKFSAKPFIIYFFVWIACIILCICLGWLYVGAEHKVWSWDYAGYWYSFQHVTNGLLNDPISALENVCKTILFDDYNSTPILVPAFIGMVLGIDRTSYIIILLFLYLAPFCILVALLLLQICASRSVKLFLSFTGMTLLFIPFWMPTLRGYPDICGLIPIVLAIMLVNTSKFGSRLEPGKAVLLGALLYAPFLLRRWYAYSILALFFTLPVYNLFTSVNIQQLIDKKLSVLQNLRIILANYFIAGISAVCLLAALQFPLLKTIISTDYSFIYSAYQQGFCTSVSGSLQVTGVFWPFLALLAFCLIMYKGNYHKKVFSIFCLVTLILTYIFFTMTQSPGMQHLLPLELWIWFIILTGSTVAYKLLGVLSIILGTLFMSCTFVYSLAFKNNYSIHNLPLLPKCLPIQVENYDEYKQLVELLEHLAPGKIAVFASSGNFNDSTLVTLSGRRLDSRITWASQVDLRDGFRLNTLMAHYVVITEKPALHLPANHQLVISIPQQAIINGQNIGKAYKEIGRTYNLADGMKAKIYEKYRIFTPGEIREFIDILCKAYPAWRDKLEEDVIKLNMVSNE